MALETASFGWLLLVLAAVAVSLLLAYLLFSGIYRAFQSVGFTRSQAALILVGSLIGGLVDVPFGAYNGWILAVNVGGAIVPVVVTVLLLRRFPGLWHEALAGIVFVAATAYLVTEATPGGIASPFPCFLLPVVVASAFSMIAYWREADHAAPLAYVAGTLGVLLGADVLHLFDFLDQAPLADASPAVASIGGASVYDMVFLTGILAVLLDMALFSRRMRERAAVPRHYEEGEVFTPGTPYHVLNGPVRLAAAPRPPSARRAR